MAGETAEPVVDPIENDGKATEGGEGTQPAEEQKVKIGEVEYTPEQLAEALKKAQDYDGLLPEFTKKSQALAALIGGKEPPKEGEEVPFYKKPGFKVKDWNEFGDTLDKVVALAEERVSKKAEQSIKSEQEAKQQVDDFVVEIKKSNKDFDDQDFFQYATRHGYRVNTIDDLKAVYSSYNEALAEIKGTEKRVLGNRAKRLDSVSKPSSSGTQPVLNSTEIRRNSNSIQDAAKEAYDRIKT